MFCRYCGAANGASAQFCATCGSRIGMEQAVAQQVYAPGRQPAPYQAAPAQNPPGYLYYSPGGTPQDGVPFQPLLPPARFVERYYLPDQLVTAGPGRRLAGRLIDVGLAMITFFIGWFIWFCIVARNGQTPGKQLLGMYILRADGSRAGGGFTWLRTFVIQGVLIMLADMMSVGIFSIVSSLWCCWDRDRQCLWDKMGGTYVAYSPTGYRPWTAADLARAGYPTPVAARAAPQSYGGAQGYPTGW